MKFIHIADVHLGAKPDAGKPWGANRGREIWDTFEAVIKEAEQKEVDLILIAGDLFHGQPLQRELKEVNYLLSTLSKAQVVIIAGNHDYIKKNSYYKSFEWNDNVFFLGDREMDRIVLDVINTDIYGFSYHSQEIPDREYDKAKIQDKNKINILLGHGGDEKHIPFNKNILKQLGFHYLAFGHIHKPEVDMSIPMAYAGSLEPLDANETGEHGYIYGEITNEKCRIELIPYCKRQYIYKTIEDDGSKSNMQLKDEIIDYMKENGTENIYKFTIDGTRNSEIEYDLDYLQCLGNILEVQDCSSPDYDFIQLQNENSENLLGKYIKRLYQQDSTQSKKALYYGTKALLDAMKR